MDEFDFSGVSNICDIDISNQLADITAFADTDMTYLEGKQGFVVSIGGLLDPVAGGYDAEMFTDLTTVDRRLGIFDDDLSGKFGYEGTTNPSEQARASETGNAIVLNVTWKGDDTIYRAVLLEVDAAVSGTVTGAKVQQGAISATETGEAVVRLLAASSGSGNNDLDITIESDADSSAGGETTRMTFTTLNQASSPTYEVKTVAGSVTDTWWRMVATYSGAGSRVFSIVVSFGIRPT